ncbi:epidermal patterning factor 1 [Artemisia annua]|uniref:Epidermal patterning factor-like protein n=1 Tax=Artemisia annua TaxID=35608 RepID=A0A2U1NI48_ARTAN|nr:epidermal patterning factor 1 [Artemisia annua]
MEMDNPDITMEEYISLEEEKALSNNRMIPTIVINDVISPEIAQDEELSQVFDLNENPAIVYKEAYSSESGYDENEDECGTMVYDAITCDFPPKVEDIFSSYHEHHYDIPSNEDNEYSNIESFDYIVYDNILQLPQQKEKIRSRTDKPGFDPTRDFEEFWDDLFKAAIRDEDELQDHYFPKQVAKRKNDEVEFIILPNEAHKAPAINPFLVELKKELKDELVDTTMIEEDGFNPMKDIEELELLLAKDPFSFFMEVKGRLTTNHTNEEERIFTHPQYTTLAHVMFKPSNLSTKSDHGHHHPTKAKPNYHGAIASAPGKQRVDPVKVPGSRLPDCSHACGSCSPCRLVMVSFVCATIEEAETCPMAYKCMCNNKSYPVP